MNFFDTRFLFKNQLSEYNCLSFKKLTEKNIYISIISVHQNLIRPCRCFNTISLIVILKNFYILNLDCLTVLFNYIK